MTSGAAAYPPNADAITKQAIRTTERRFTNLRLYQPLGSRERFFNSRLFTRSGILAVHEMKRLRLTKKQRTLQKEVSALLEWLGVIRDLTAVKPARRSDYLTWAKRELITTTVLRQYVLMDEHLNNEICWQFFPRRTYPELWRTKRFRAFNNYILDRLSLLPKLDFARARIRLPEKFYKDIRDLNALRNALAHSFFPENRRSKPKWKGVDIFDFAGVGQFIHDTSDASAFFFARLRRQGRHPRRWNNRKRLASSERIPRNETLGSDR